MTLRSVFRKQIFQFEAWQICIAHDWLSKNKLFLLCKSSKSHVLRSERLIHLFHLWNWPRCKLEQCKQNKQKILKHLAKQCLIVSRNRSYKVVLAVQMPFLENILSSTSTAGFNLFMANSTSYADYYLAFDQASIKPFKCHRHRSNMQVKVYIYTGLIFDYY